MITKSFTFIKITVTSITFPTSVSAAAAAAQSARHTRPTAQPHFHYPNRSASSTAFCRLLSLPRALLRVRHRHGRASVAVRRCVLAVLTSRSTPSTFTHYSLYAFLHAFSFAICSPLLPSSRKESSMNSSCGSSSSGLPPAKPAQYPWSPTRFLLRCHAPDTLFHSE